MRGLSLPDIGLAQYEVGYGLKVSVEERWVMVGSARFMEMSGITIPADYLKIQQAAHEEGYSLVYVAIDSQFAGAIELHPTIRPEARELVRQLQQKNIATVIISGDSEKPTQKLAATLGIDRYFAETLPEDKASLIEQLQEQGNKVCFPPRLCCTQCGRWHQRLNRHEKGTSLYLAFGSFYRCH